MTFTPQWINPNVDYAGSNATTKPIGNLTLYRTFSAGYNISSYACLINQDNLTSDDILYFATSNNITAARLNTPSSTLPSALWTSLGGSGTIAITSDGDYLASSSKIIRSDLGTTTDNTQPIGSSLPYFDQSDNLLDVYPTSGTSNGYVYLRKYKLDKTTGILTLLASPWLVKYGYSGIFEWGTVSYCYLDTSSNLKSDITGTYRELFICGYFTAAAVGYTFTFWGIKAFKDYTSNSIASLPEINSYTDPDSNPYTGMIYFPDPGGYTDVLFVSTQDKLIAYKWDTGVISKIFSVSIGTGSNGTGAALAHNGTTPNEPFLYFRNGKTIKLFYFSYFDGFHEMASSILLPNTPGHILLTNSGILCTSYTGSGSNIHLLDLNLNFISGTLTPGGTLLNTRPSIGSKTYFCLNAESSGSMYIYGNYGNPTTTTTTTTPSPTTTTTTSTGTGTTTTTTTLIPPTTTTTTTTRPPLAIVETSQFELVNGQFVSVQTSNASDSSTTQNSLLSQSLTFGTIAPNATSKTIVVALNIPYAKAITNIKIGLVSSGGITFANNIFGITSSVELRDDITPDGYFQGVNANKVSTDSYNIDIRNKDNHTSEYVYLNVKLPNDQIIGEGMIGLKWFFDYSE
jgi:hypothetical protein